MDRHVEVLRGGVTHVGAVVRDGDDVLRPASSNHPTIHRLLRHLAESGARIAPEPTALVDNARRERLRFIPGNVPIPPYPTWAQSDDTLVSMTKLIRALHDASRTFPHQPDDAWNTEGADPERGGRVICHGDVCLENVVFRAGTTVALLDFDFATPGRPIYDLACFARMCVPIDDEVSRARLGWAVAELPHRLRLIADAYGASPNERIEIVPLLDHVIERHGATVEQRAAAGDPGYVTMWEAMGGHARLDRRREWWAEERSQFVAVMR